LLVIAVLEDPIFSGDGAVYGEEERIPSSVHTPSWEICAAKRTGVEFAVASSAAALSGAY
jgi:hypothetical protein